MIRHLELNTTLEVISNSGNGSSSSNNNSGNSSSSSSRRRSNTSGSDAVKTSSLQNRGYLSLAPRSRSKKKHVHAGEWCFFLAAAPPAVF